MKYADEISKFCDALEAQGVRRPYVYHYGEDLHLGLVWYGEHLDCRAVVDLSDGLMTGHASIRDPLDCECEGLEFAAVPADAPALARFVRAGLCEDAPLNGER